MWMSANRLENYFSEDGTVFSRAYIDSPNLVLDSKETDRDKVGLLRRLWVAYIERLDIRTTGYPEVVTIS